MVRAFSSLVGFMIKQFLAMFVFDYVVLTCSKGTMSSSKTDWKSPPGALELISSLGPEHQNYPPSLEAQLLMVVWNESDLSECILAQMKQIALLYHAWILTTNANEHSLKKYFPWHPKLVFIQIHQEFNMLNKFPY